MRDWKRVFGKIFWAPLLAAAALATATTASAATVTVNTTADQALGSCSVSCSLRDAVATANPGDTIQIPAGHYVLSLGEIIFAKSLTINGAGARSTVLDGNAADRIFQLSGPQDTTTLEIDDVALVNGFVNTNRGDPFGGALLGSGILKLQRCLIANNQTASGGGINWIGPVTIDQCTVAGNHAIFYGGGIVALGPLTITNSTLTTNVVTGLGGGAVSFGDLLPGQYHGHGKRGSFWRRRGSFKRCRPVHQHHHRRQPRR